jgi:hypothetical protein
VRIGRAVARASVAAWVAGHSKRGEGIEVAGAGQPANVDRTGRRNRDDVGEVPGKGGAGCRGLGQAQRRHVQSRPPSIAARSSQDNSLR